MIFYPLLWPGWSWSWGGGELHSGYEGATIARGTIMSHAPCPMSHVLPRAPPPARAASRCAPPPPVSRGMLPSRCQPGPPLASQSPAASSPLLLLLLVLLLLWVMLSCILWREVDGECLLLTSVLPRPS